MQISALLILSLTVSLVGPKLKLSIIQILAQVTTLSATAGNQTELLGAKLGSVLLSDFALSGFCSFFATARLTTSLLALVCLHKTLWRYLAVRSRGGEWGPFREFCTEPPLSLHTQYTVTVLQGLNVCQPSGAPFWLRAPKCLPCQSTQCLWLSYGRWNQDRDSDQ